MNDMSAAIQPKSDQINADDLIAGPRTVTIAGVQINAGTEQPVSIRIEGESKVYRPCKSMSRVLVECWGPDASKYVGRAVTLYRDPTVKWGGLEVGGIRISHLSDIDRERVMALTATKGKRTPHMVKPLASAPAGLSREAASDAILNAKSLDELRTIWRRKDMAPHREALNDELEVRKEELSADAPETEDAA